MNFEGYYKNSDWFGTYESDLMMKEAFDAGQQSMQAKVEELEKRVEAFKDHAAMLRSAAKSYAYTEREQNILLSQADDIEKILGLEQRPNGEEQ
ncbi:hypothetical protein [Acinetobacter baumannii]|uniref:hypothetical protein n=1 Tax=Acinetobacter baumannii TaxID=470 RepID=UPI003A8C7E0D